MPCEERCVYLGRLIRGEQQSPVLQTTKEVAVTLLDHGCAGTIHVQQAGDGLTGRFAQEAVCCLAAQKPALVTVKDRLRKLEHRTRPLQPLEEGKYFRR